LPRAGCVRPWPAESSRPRHPRTPPGPAARPRAGGPCSWTRDTKC
jgi:hypothetical protein